MNKKRFMELGMELTAAARVAMQSHAMSPCDDRTKAQIMQTLVGLLERNYPAIGVKVIDKTPKTLEEKVAFELMDMNDPNMMHLEVQLTPPTIEYIELKLRLDQAEADLSVEGGK